MARGVSWLAGWTSTVDLWIPWADSDRKTRNDCARRTRTQRDDCRRSLSLLYRSADGVFQLGRRSRPPPVHFAGGDGAGVRVTVVVSAPWEVHRHRHLQMAGSEQ